MRLNEGGTPCWKPIGDLTVPAGYAASAKIQSDRSDSDSQANFNDLCKLAEEIMSDPLKMRMLGDRVYQLLLEDLRLQKERSRSY
jgi:hypothetical protein